MSSTKSAKSGKSKGKTCILNAAIPAADGVLDCADLVKYLMTRIKVNNRAGNLGSAVTVEQDKKNLSNVVVRSSEPELSKRYIKYLTKKYLKKQKLRDYIRTVSSKDGYLLKYFSVAGDADEEDEEEDE